MPIDLATDNSPSPEHRPDLKKSSTRGCARLAAGSGDRRAQPVEARPIQRIIELQHSAGQASPRSERTGARTFAQAASPAVKTSRVNKRFLEKWVSISVTDDSYLRQMCLLQILHRPRRLLCYIETGSPDFPAQLRTASSSWSRLAAASAHRCRA